MLDLATFNKEIKLLLPNFGEKTFLLAVSGGADSMVLADLFLKLNINFQISHINYKLRKVDSDLDENLVEDLCIKNNIKFNVYRVSDIDHCPENSIQLWARNLRYSYFNKTSSEENLDHIVTAHHLNDDLETFIINLSRGSGLKGLSGIPAKKNKILRPLLKFSKEEIYAYAKKNDVQFREDLSNQKNDYLRNKIRNEIVPKLGETNDHFLNNFKSSLAYLQQTRAFVKDQISAIEKQLLINESANKIVYDKEFLKKQDNFVQFEILRKFGFEDVNEISKIFLAETGKSFHSKKHQLLINREELIIAKNSTIKDDLKEIIILESLKQENPAIIDLQKILLENTNSTILKGFLKKENSINIWEFDGEKLVFPLKIRHRKEGDIFHPINMFGRKKVSKYFKDEKISILDKKEIWLLVDGNDEILGVIPFRQDKRSAANKKTQRILTIRVID